MEACHISVAPLAPAEAARCRWAAPVPPETLLDVSATIANERDDDEAEAAADEADGAEGGRCRADGSDEDRERRQRGEDRWRQASNVAVAVEHARPSRHPRATRRAAPAASPAPPPGASARLRRSRRSYPWS